VMDLYEKLKKGAIAEMYGALPKVYVLSFELIRLVRPKFVYTGAGLGKGTGDELLRKARRFQACVRPVYLRIMGVRDGKDSLSEVQRVMRFADSYSLKKGVHFKNFEDVLAKNPVAIGYAREDARRSYEMIRTSVEAMRMSR